MEYRSMRIWAVSCYVAITLGGYSWSFWVIAKFTMDIAHHLVQQLELSNYTTKLNFQTLEHKPYIKIRPTCCTSSWVLRRSDRSFSSSALSVETVASILLMWWDTVSCISCASSCRERSISRNLSECSAFCSLYNKDHCRHINSCT